LRPSKILKQSQSLFKNNIFFNFENILIFLGVNWATSSDGPLVNILKELAEDPIDLSTLPEDQRYVK